MFGKKKVKTKWFQYIGIKITGETKKEVDNTIKGINTYLSEYEGNCEFIFYIDF